MGQLLAAQLAHPAAEEIEAAPRHHFEQLFVPLHFHHLHPGVTQDIHIQPPLALTEGELAQPLEVGHFAHRPLLLRADKTDAVADDAQMDGKTDIGEPQILAGAAVAVHYKEVGIVVELHADPLARLGHGRRRLQQIVAKLVAGLVEGEPQQLPIISGARVPLALRADIGKPGGRLSGQRQHAEQSGSQQMQG